MDKIRIAVLAAVLVALAALGVGCLKGRKMASLKPFDVPVTVKSDKPGEPPREPTQDELHEEVRAALRNFRETKSFRANISIKTAEGQVKSNINVAKPNRLQGTIETARDAKFGLIIVDHDVFLKFNDSNWAKLANKSDNKMLVETFQSSLSGGSSLDVLGIDDKTPIKKFRRASQNCDLFKTSLKKEDGKLQEVDLCVQNGYPKILETKTDDGPLSIEYYDYNAVFLIEKPMK